MRELLIATKNIGKIPEMAMPLEGTPFTIVSLLDMPGVEEVEETGHTYEENAILKATAYGKKTGILALADDSGLEIDALGGEPGVQTAYFLSGTYQEKMTKLLEMLRDVPDSERGARFRSVVAVYDPGTDTVRTCEGVVEGSITREIRGENGFGYDPIFDYENSGKTGGENAREEKLLLSHRARAMQKAREILLKEFV
ncbi:MAG: dITP/XTP pyrophosphatase [Parcubacteria group bacterium Athens0416_74]|nr:MAG: dITP/XTP pyrophosphatase [Parcubacteria group bacterium Athens0416_74]